MPRVGGALRGESTHARKRRIDMNWMGMVKGATISLTVHNKGGWGEFSG
jgi:hypothetical protein